MTYFRQNISGVQSAAKPIVSPTVGGRLAKRSRVRALLRAQDRPVALGRRVVAAQSLAGETSWLVVDTAPPGNALTHPINNSLRAVLRAACLVTPGHVLQGSCLYIGSGQTVVFNGASQWPAAGKSGSIAVQVDWTAEDASTATTTRAANLAPAGDPDGAAPANPWNAIKLAKIADVQPPAFNANADVARWTQHTGADITLSHVGGARVIDACLYEAPKALARAHDDAADQAVSQLHGSPTPGAGGPQVLFPVEELGATDPRGGTLRTMEVAQAQRLRLGPALISWTAWTESASVVGTDVAVSTTSSSFVRLWDGVSTSYRADEPGWSLSSGAYARNYDESHPYYAANVGTIPVLVAVYASTGSGVAGVLRVQATAWSWVDVTIPANATGWAYAYGHLRVGKGPGDASIVQAFFRRTAGATAVGVIGVSVFHAGQFTPNL